LLNLSGEAGSGKTELGRRALKHLIALGSKKKSSKINRHLQALPIVLEALGGARTKNSDSSSRFSSQLSLQFNKKGRLVGAHENFFCLDKFRVTKRAPGEYNFHVFYYMLAGLPASEKTALRINHDSNHFSYLSGPSAKGVQHHESHQFDALLEAFKALGIGKRIQSQIFSLLAAILHLGEIQFVDQEDKKNESCSVKNDDVVEFVASLLGILPDNLLYFLTNVTKKNGKEQYTVCLNSASADKQRNSLAQNLYYLLLEWIVDSCNSKLSKYSEDVAATFELVDLMGFQNNDSNKLEEYCVNYTQEALQQFIIKTVFKNWEQFTQEDQQPHTDSEYLQTNSELMELLDDPGNGVNSHIYNETRLFCNGQGSADGLVERLNRSHSSNEKYIVTRIASSAFGIQHGGGSVIYDHGAFIEANLDHVRDDFIVLFRGTGDIPPTSNRFVYNLFTEKTLAVRIPTPPLEVATKSKKKKRDSKRESQSASEIPHVETNLGNLKTSLSVLFKSLSKTQPWLALCVQPGEKKNGKLDSSRVKSQLKSLPIFDLCNNKGMVYPFVYTHAEFIERYHTILQDIPYNHVSEYAYLSELVQVMGWSFDDAFLGETSIFLEMNTYTSLEQLLRKAEKEDQKDIHPDYVTDNQSVYSDAESQISDNRSEASDVGPNPRTAAQTATKEGVNEKDFIANAPSHIPVETMINEDDKPSKTKARKRWECCTWTLTWWIPTFCISLCGMKRKDIQMAWREKVALNILILLLSLIVIFYISVFGILICPKEDVFSTFEIQDHNSYKSAYVYTMGQVFDVTTYGKVHETSYGVDNNTFITRTAGRDVSPLFEYDPEYCAFGDPDKEQVLSDFKFREYNLTELFTVTHRHDDPGLAIMMMKKYKKGDLVYDLNYVSKVLNGKGKKFFRVVGQEVFDMTDLLSSGNFTPEVQTALLPANLGPSLVRNKDTIDWTKYFQDNLSPNQRKEALQCLRALFKVGRVDNRNSFRCQFANYMLFTASCLLVAVILFKFLAALQLGSLPSPEDNDRFVICQVPCYTEDEESLKRTINSLAALKYDDKRKLLFIICDGMIVGSGNDRPTPKIVMDILGVNPDVEPEPLSYVALGEGMKRHNMAKVYSGLYEITGHVVPYIVVAKIGKPGERSRPGNRGKRDSQIVLMQFLNRVHYDKPMNPMELEIYHQMKNVIGVNPSFYEYVLMVDADTVVMSDSLNRMVSVCVRDSSIMGLCGETRIANEKESWATMIQVYEYFISHHMAKAFESLFGTVTCLPGCFCMYRIRAPNKSTPLLINNGVLEDYSENKVDTLHVKNLLSLGEDRYLTTLMLKHFPKFKMVFTQDAQCETHVPDRWSVLLSQRRRWINSTVHNLAELMFLDQLCGFCCFSMRFIVILDLFATLIMPATLLYLGYLIAMLFLSDSQLPMISLILLAAVYALQVIIFIVKGQYQHIGWLIIYLLALPIYSLYLPLYAFWHFDDFSWGNTRVVVGDNNKQIFLPESDKFNPESIPLKRWDEFEQELWEMGSDASEESKVSGTSGLSSSSKRSVAPADDFFANHKVAGFKNNRPLDVPELPPVANPRYSMLSSGNGYPQVAPPMYQSPGLLVNGNLNDNMAQARHSLISNGSGFNPAYTVPAAPLLPSGHHSPDFPSDQELFSEINRILSGADLTSITKKKIRDELSAFFKVDLQDRKEYINQCIDKCLGDMR
jgi:chitin synthase